MLPSVTTITLPPKLGQLQKAWTFDDPEGDTDLEGLQQKGRAWGAHVVAGVSAEAWPIMVHHEAYLGVPYSVPSLMQQSLIPENFTVFPQEASC